MTIPEAKKYATISECTRYRYMLSRIWNPDRGVVAFVGLNPSTADAEKDDHTVRTCMRYAQSWGYGGICMLNLFAFRTRSPAVMLKASEPVGIENDWHIEYLAWRAQRVIVAWGRHGNHMSRAARVARLLPPMECLAVNKDGTPHHPLYLPADIQPQPWSLMHVVNG